MQNPNLIALINKDISACNYYVQLIFNPNISVSKKEAINISELEKISLQQKFDKEFVGGENGIGGYSANLQEKYFNNNPSKKNVMKIYEDNVRNLEFNKNYASKTRI